jgi:hypothetical protein
MIVADRDPKSISQIMLSPLFDLLVLPLFITTPITRGDGHKIASVGKALLINHLKFAKPMGFFKISNTCGVVGAFLYDFGSLLFRKKGRFWVR